MQAQQFDLFDLVVNIVPTVMFVLLLIPLGPPAVINFLTNLDGVQIAGLGIIVLVISYGFGELFYGIAKYSPSVGRVRGTIIAGLQRTGYIDTAPEDYEGPFWKYHWAQTYLERMAAGKREPYLDTEIAHKLLRKAEAEYDLNLLEETDDGYETNHLDAFYYLGESKIYDKNTLFGEFQIQSQLFLTMWFVFTLTFLFHLLTTVLGIVGAYEPVWMISGTRIELFVRFVVLGLFFSGLSVLSLRLHIAAKKRQVKRFIFDSYEHL